LLELRVQQADRFPGEALAPVAVVRFADALAGDDRVPVLSRLEPIRQDARDEWSAGGGLTARSSVLDIVGLAEPETLLHEIGPPPV
jgi:hypothetical protein